MAEIVGSAMACEALSRVSSFLSGDKTSHESVEDKAERLEMAVLKIRSVVAVSDDLHISHLPLLLWKAKLKRIAEEGDDLLLHMHKKRHLECGRVSDNTTGNSISQYLIQAAKRFVPFCRKEDELSDNTLRRFERLADGTDSFFRLVQSGGHPKKPVFLPSLTRSLLAGDSVEFSIQRKSGNDHIMLWPWLDASTESGLVACLGVSREDEVMWQEGFKMCVLFRLSEASNILATAMSCLELLPPQFDAASVGIRGLLTETIGQSVDRLNLSERSVWCCRRIQSYHHHDCESSAVEKDRVTGMLSLPHPVLRLTTFCYALPSIDTKENDIQGSCMPSLFFFSPSMMRVSLISDKILLPGITLICQSSLRPQRSM
ncbi:hypothetical protein GQ55_3G303400 [Panicum hallii var. hallii]|uniref:Rx N-terminal domain-containing protein n=1 Tax=Panicum hallii var. hallii TaxID=1504633 RepID=A0A2T7EEZ2_9POAL|nr:hypothetical protein GQ55_3G303400 [Panicum hallii var. hallii]